MTIEEEVKKEPWRFDFMALLRHFEATNPDKPRIGEATTIAGGILRLTQEPFLEFPSATISRVERDENDRLRVAVRFLGMFGPQGPLPLATTLEAYQWMANHDDAFVRFIDLFQGRFLELFFRAWANSRPIAQHDRKEDRFAAYLGSFLGIGSPAFRNTDALPEYAKLQYAGLLSSRVRSVSRLKGFLAGLFGVKVAIEEFVGTWLPLPPDARTRLGKEHAQLGVATMVGSNVHTVQEKFRIRIGVTDLEEFAMYLPEGELAGKLADAVFLCLGNEYEWDVELALPEASVVPTKLGVSGRLGWSSWMVTRPSDGSGQMRTDARFDLAARRGVKESGNARDHH